jgi:hypothetical protein
MRPGTESIVGHLKRARTAKFTRQQWADLVDDVTALGREEFLRVVMGGGTQSRPSRGTKTQAKVDDPLLDLMARYQKKSGLKMVDFIAALHRKLGDRLERQPTKEIAKSSPKYLSFARQTLRSEEIEAGLAAVLDEYA